MKAKINMSAAHIRKRFKPLRGMANGLAFPAQLNNFALAGLATHNLERNDG